MTQIVIEIEGGLVQAVWSTDSALEVSVLDRDLPDHEEDRRTCLEEIRELEALIKTLDMVDVS